MSDWRDGIWLKDGEGHFKLIGVETYFTPARYWSILRWLIALCSGGTMIYQFKDNGKRTIVDGVGWWYPLLGALNIVYLLVWTRQFYVTAFILTLIIWGVVSRIYYFLVKTHYIIKRSIYDQLWIYIPLSLHHGSTTVLLVIEAFEAFGVNAQTDTAGAFTKLFVFLGLLLLEAASEAYAFQPDGGDVAANMAVTWTLFAIFVQQHNSGNFMYWSTLVFAIMSLLGLFKNLWRPVLGPHRTKALQITNVVAWFALVLLHFVLLAIKYPYNEDHPYEVGKETYLTPAPYVFIFWPFILLLLFGPVAYQFADNGKKIVIDRIGWWFPLLIVLNFVPLLFYNGHHITRFLLALSAWVVISYIYYILKKYYVAEDIRDQLCVHVPFSFFHGWTTFLLVVKSFEAFGADTWFHPEPENGLTKALILFGLLCLDAASEVYAFPDEGDVAANVAITWSLFGIFVHQRLGNFVHWASLAAATVSVLGVGKSLYGLIFARPGAIRLLDEESESVPLADAP